MDSNPLAVQPSAGPLGQLQQLLELIWVEVRQELEAQLTIPASDTWVCVWHARVTIIGTGDLVNFAKCCGSFCLQPCPL